MFKGIKIIPKELKTKLTLSIKRSTIIKAKIHKINISNICEQFLDYYIKKIEENKKSKNVKSRNAKNKN